MKVAIVGAGWAGLACAVMAVRAGHAVTVFEAARTTGGRARRVDSAAHGLALDNGQHILIGAYTATLGLMREVGIDPERVLRRLPLSLRFADGGGLQVPAGLPTPLDLLAGILGARGWSWAERLALLRRALGWRRAGFRCAPQDSVADLCRGLPPRVVDELVEPLCISALNTPIAQASGSVFLRVLRDALFSGRGGADLLLPRVDLGALFPDAAERWLRAHGAQLRIAARVQAVARTSAGWRVDDAVFDRVVLACSPWEAERLVREATLPEAAAWLAAAQALRHEGIATVYARGDGRALAAPILALRSGADAPAQFVFDRGQLDGPPGLLAFVASVSQAPREELQAAVLRQAAAQLGLKDLQPVQTVVEKRATFACTPGLRRPGAAVAPGLLACGDYVEGPYPATLEGAVRSAADAAAAL